MCAALCTTEKPDLEGINSITLGDSSLYVIHDLSGRRLKHADMPGLYIVNGKKVYVR